MDSFEKELQTVFKFKLENKHVIDMDQVMISILSKGCKGNSLNYSYKSRDNDDLLQDLCNILLRIAKSTDGGMLVFFPSYTAL